MLSKNTLFFYSLLMIFPTLASADLSYANKLQAMKSAMEKSPLDLKEKVEHIGNRLGYGTSPLPFHSEVTVSANDPQYLDKVMSRFATLITEQISIPYVRGYSDEIHNLAKGLVLNDSMPSHFDSNYDQMIEYMGQEDHAPAASGTMRDQVLNLKILKALLGSQNIKSNALDPKAEPKVIDEQINLRAVLDEFWFNHFNIDLMKVAHRAAGIDGYDYVIHQKMYTTFYDLLKSVTTHPAMLVYLDNANNRMVANEYNHMENGKLIRDRVEYVASNQNLGRELLELHTLGKGPLDPKQTNFRPGLDYSQSDVEVAAKILAGHNVVNGKYEFVSERSSFNDYRIRPKGVNASFAIFPKHDLMTKSFDRVGIDRLSDLLLFLSKHPQTQKNICTKLTKIFIHDADENISSNVINKCIKKWGDKGNLKEMYFAIVSSPEFWSKSNFKNHIKNPFELVVSQYRSRGISLAHFKNVKDGSIYKSPEGITKNGAAFGGIPYISSLINNANKSILEYGLPLGKHAEPTGYAQDGTKWLSQRFYSCVGRSAFSAANFQDLIDFKWADQDPVLNSLYKRDLLNALLTDSASNNFQTTFTFFFKNRLAPTLMNFDQRKLLGNFLSDDKLTRRSIGSLGEAEKVNTFVDLMISHTEFLYR